MFSTAKTVIVTIIVIMISLVINLLQVIKDSDDNMFGQKIKDSDNDKFSWVISGKNIELLLTIEK